MKLALILIVSFLVTVLIMPMFIKWLQERNIKQSIRDLTPETHKKKSGTPTMGGAVILFVFLVTTLVFVNLSAGTLLLLFITVGTGLIGFVDDFIKVVMGRNLGLTSKQKLVLQIIVASVFMYFVHNLVPITYIDIPVIDARIDLGWFYFVFAIFLILGTTNATNLTDGLDGLLSGTAIIAISAFALILFSKGYSDFFEMALILIGTIAGFLVFNKNPAKVFMGDTGSLAIGGFLAGLAIMLKLEILLAIIGLVFVIETLSVIIQVTSFKLTGKRVFRMTPIHHHFELAGHKEVKVVYGFWIFGLLAAVAGYLIYVLF